MSAQFLSANAELGRQRNKSNQSQQNVVSNHHVQSIVTLHNQTPLPFQIIEQYDQLYALPRAVHFDDETMRVFQACGLANEVVKTTKVNKGMKFMDKVSFLATKF